MKLCPSCKSVQRDKAPVCSVCGSGFNEGGAAEAPAEQAPREPTPPVQETPPQQDMQPPAADQTPPETNDTNTSGIYEVETSKDSVYSADSETIYDDSVYEMSEDIASQTEILEQIEDLRNDGFNVSRLEKALDMEPQKIWDTLAEYMSDVEELQVFKKKMSALNTTGFESDADIINQTLNDPDKLEEIRVLINFLETKMSKQVENSAPEPAVKTPPVQQPETPAVPETPTQPETPLQPQQPTVVEKPPEVKSTPPPDKGDSTTLNVAKSKGISLLDVIKKLTLARNSYSAKNYPKAKALYGDILEMDPSNDEAKFYMDKIDEDMAKTQENGTAIKVLAPKKMLAPKMLAPKMIKKEDAPKQIPAGAEKASSTETLVNIKEDPVLKKEVLDDLAGIKKDKGDKKPKPKKKDKPKEEAPEMTEEEKKIEMARNDARAFKALINKNYKDALGYYDQMMKIDPDFKDLKKKRAECLEKISRKPIAKKKKKKSTEKMMCSFFFF